MVTHLWHALASLGVGLGAGVATALALLATGHGGLLADLARALGGLVAWRLVEGSPLLTIAALFGCNLAACSVVAFGGAGAVWLEMRARSRGGLVDRVFRAAHRHDTWVARLVRGLLDTHPDSPRAGLLVAFALPILCLLVNGLYNGLIAVAAAQAIGPGWAPTLLRHLPHAPLELGALVVAGGIGFGFAAAGIASAASGWPAAALREALRRTARPAFCAALIALLLAASVVEVAVLAG